MPDGAKGAMSDSRAEAYFSLPPGHNMTIALPIFINCKEDLALAPSYPTSSHVVLAASHNFQPRSKGPE